MLLPVSHPPRISKMVSHRNVRPVAGTYRVVAPRVERPLPGAGAHGMMNMFMQVINIVPGHDVRSEVMAFAQSRPLTIVLSGNGRASVVTLRTPNDAAGVRHEGIFDVWTLSGTFSSDSNVVDGHLNALFSNGTRDGHCIGGVVAGPLIAYTHVQVVVTSMQPRPRPRPRQGA